MGKQHLSRTPCLKHNLLIIKFKSYKSGHKLSMSKIPGYYLQLSLCCSNSKIGIFHFFGGVKCASGDTVRQVMEDGMYATLNGYPHTSSAPTPKLPVCFHPLVNTIIVVECNCVVKEKKKKTYGSWDSLVVTHPTTNQPACSLSMTEQTGSPVFYTL